MKRLLKELDYQPTSIGPISLWRRRELRLDFDALEIRLGDEHLISDSFNTSEIVLAKIGLDAKAIDANLSVFCRLAWNEFYCYYCFQQSAN